MGIDLQKKPPTLRPPVSPVELFFDSTYSDSFPSVVVAQLFSGQAAPTPGTRVELLSLKPGIVTVWVSDQGARCVAEIEGAEATPLSDACRAFQTGFSGTVTAIGSLQGNSRFQVCIDGA